MSATYNNDVEATRAGMIYARPEGTRQYQAWRRRSRAKVAAMENKTIGLKGEALETAILGFAKMHPEYVIDERKVSQP